MDIYSGLAMEDFLLAVLTGALIAVVYDALRILRILLGLSRGVTAVLDILFMAFSAVLTFLLCLAVNFGFLRLVLLLGEVLGFALYFLTFGFITLWVVRLFLRILHFFYRKIIFPVLRWFGQGLFRVGKGAALWVQKGVGKGRKKKKTRKFTEKRGKKAKSFPETT